jgi:hypothetical protein
MLRIDQQRDEDLVPEVGELREQQLANHVR